MSRRTWDGDTPVVGVDIDGTLAHYHSHFLAFARGWLGVDSLKGWPGPPEYRNRNMWWGDYDYQTVCKLHEYMGISKATYRKCKLAFRQGGLKRSMLVYKGAHELMVALRRRAWVVVCTTRPYLHLNNIEPDTMEWLRRNRIPYDDVIMGEHKYRDLHRRYSGHVAAVIDDDPSLLSQAASLSPPIPTLFMARSHNAHAVESQPWWAQGCDSARQMLVEHLKRGTWVLGTQPTNEEF